jgi:hypothetical protein
MIIRVDTDNNIIQVIEVGDHPGTPDCIAVDSIPSDVADDIFSYKYIDGQFVRKPDTDDKHTATAKDVKIAFLSSTCKSLIERGIDINDEHYSLSYADQINLSKLATQAAMMPSLPIFYHADGKLCRQYTPEEILNISQIAVAWVTYHTTYNNFAKAYIKSLCDFTTIRNFKYGDRLSEELQKQLDEILETTHIIFGEIIVDPFDYDTILYPERDPYRNGFYVPTPEGINPV